MDFADSPWLWDSGTPQPSFERDFARDKELDRGGTGPAITFTRASNATFFNASGVLQTASNDQPRFDHDPATGASRGLLIEESRTNLVQRSEELDNAYWTKEAGVTVTANADTAPNGTTTADRITFSSSSIACYRDVSTAAATYTGSFYVKAGSSGEVGKTISIGVGDLVNGVTSYADKLITLSNSWQRVDHFKTTITGTCRVGVHTWAGATARDVLVWGFQLEAGAFPTSYIPTTTAAATRSADSAVVTPISSFYNQSEGTFITDTNKSPLSGSFPTLWHLTNGTNDTGNVIGFYNPSNSTIVYDASPAFSHARAVSAGLASSGFAFSAASSRMAVNGALTPSTDQPSTITTDKASLRLGAKRNGSEPLNGHIRKIAYYPRRLSNTLLQQLTT